MPDENGAVLDGDRARAFFGQYSMALGSTGNLGTPIRARSGSHRSLAAGLSAPAPRGTIAQ